MVRLATPLRDQFCVGIDLHKYRFTLACLDPHTGEVIYRKFACKCHTQTVEYFTALPRPTRGGG